MARTSPAMTDRPGDISRAGTGEARDAADRGPRRRRSRSSSNNFEHGFPEGFGPNIWGHLAYAIGIAFAVFQLYVAAFNYLPSQVVRGIHVGFLLLLTFGLIGNFTAKTEFGRAAARIVGALGFACGLYQWIFYADLIAARRRSDPRRSRGRTFSRY
jgi:hypothetical protein